MLDFMALYLADDDDDASPATTGEWLTAGAWVLGLLVPWALIICGIAATLRAA